MFKIFTLKHIQLKIKFKNTKIPLLLHPIDYSSIFRISFDLWAWTIGNLAIEECIKLGLEEDLRNISLSYFPFVVGAEEKLKGT